MPALCAEGLAARRQRTRTRDESTRNRDEHRGADCRARPLAYRKSLVHMRTLATIRETGFAPLANGPCRMVADDNGSLREQNEEQRLSFASGRSTRSICREAVRERSEAG